jgi:hypothetical protein
MDHTEDGGTNEEEKYVITTHKRPSSHPLRSGMQALCAVLMLTFHRVPERPLELSLRKTQVNPRSLKYRLMLQMDPRSHRP